MAYAEPRRRRLRKPPPATGPAPTEHGVDTSAVLDPATEPIAEPEPGSVRTTVPGSGTTPGPTTAPGSPPTARPSPVPTTVPTTGPSEDAGRPGPPARPAARPSAASGVRPTSGAGGRSGSAAKDGGDDREAERGLRGLVGSGSSQVSVGAAMRARDAARPTATHLAAAEERLIIVRRNWVPREELPRNR